MYGMVDADTGEREDINREALEARIRRLAVCNYCSVEVRLDVVAFALGCIHKHSTKNI